MNYVYLLKSIEENPKYYLGSTTDLKRRLIEHNAQIGCKTTKSNIWELIYYEAYLTIELARKRERQLKNNRGSKRALYNRLNIKFK